MSKTSSITLISALLASVFTDSCRPPLEFTCDGDCLVTGVASGGAGESDGTLDETGGAAAGAGASGQPGAGAPDASVPECGVDADCADGSFCNGAETCRAGVCESAAAVECAPQTACIENDDGAGAGCRLRESERFYLCSSDDFGEPFNAVGLPLTPLEPSPQNFSGGVIEGEFEIYVDTYDRDWTAYAWSPNGRRVIFPAYTFSLEWDLYEEKFYYFDVGAPVDAQPRRLPEIPINDRAFEVASWSADGNALVLGAYDAWLELYTGWFAVRFTEAGAESAALPGSGVAFICADNATVAVTAGDSTRLFQPWQPGSTERVLPMKAVSISPDGETLLLSSSDSSAVAPCSLETQLELLGGFGSPSAVGSWSSDSRYVVVGDSVTYVQDEPSLKHLSGYSVPSEDVHGVLFEATAADPRVLFEPGSARFVYVQQAGEEDPPVWRSADLDDTSNDFVLAVPPDLSVNLWRNDYLSAASWVGGTGALSLTTEDAGPLLLPVALGAELRAAHSGLFSEDGRRELWTQKELIDGETYTQAYSLSWTEEGALPQALFSQPFAGSLSFRNALVLESESESDTDAEATTVYSLPPGAIDPVPVNRRKNATNCSLQPQR
jgi:hypothetical protein